jgi:hypothetical protein
MKLMDNYTWIKERMNIANEGSSKPPALPPFLYYASPLSTTQLKPKHLYRCHLKIKKLEADMETGKKMLEP